MALTPEERLRNILGEPIPEGGTADDTLLSDEMITDFLDQANGNSDRAAFEGWRVKAALLSDLVDVTDGNASRKFSDLMDHALDMVKAYQRSTEGPTEGRTRIGRIVRT